MEKPIVADKDIECYVYIRKYDHVEETKKHGLRSVMHKLLKKCDPTGITYTKYYEPFRNVEMKPGTSVNGKSNRSYTGEFNGINHYRIDDGFVNGMLRSDYYGVAIPYKATIPSGTEFYVNNGLFRIAARKMSISKHPVTVMPTLQETLSPMMPLLLDEIFGNDDTIKPGFYYMTDGTCLNPNKTKMDFPAYVCGIVTGVDNDKITVMSLDEKRMVWCKLENPTRICADSDVDSSGEEAMLTLMRNEHYGDAFIPARWCTKYENAGGLRGTWHMGSVPEVISAVRENMLEINLAIAHMNDVYGILTQTEGRYPLINCLSNYWTSVDSEDEYAYAVDGTDGRLIRCNKLTAELNVRAFMTKIKPLNL